MASGIQGLAIVLVVLAAVGYLAHRVWQSYVRFAAARRAERATSPCGPSCGCDH